MENIKLKFLSLLNEIPVFEGVILLILTIITVFRKELSSNRDYRKQKSSSNINWKPMTKMTEKLFEKLNLMESTNIENENEHDDIVVNTTNRGSFQAINRDLLIFLLGYLTNLDICRLSCADKRLASFLHSDFVWEQIWVQRYEGLWRNKLVRSILSRRNIRWDPFNNWGPPSQGWKLFLFEFEYAWLDWILAGSNCSTLCLIGLNGGVYDITSFVYEHPGSPETLLDHSGRDGTITFNEIGHSLLALTLKDSYLIYQPDYVSNHLKSIILQMKKKYQNEFQKNPIQTLKSQNPNLLIPFSTRRTISVDVDDCEQRLVIIPETCFEQKMNYEREFIHKLAETHYREINYHQEIQLFELIRDDEMQLRHMPSPSSSSSSPYTSSSARYHGGSTQSSSSHSSSQSSPAAASAANKEGTHVRCHEIAKLNQENQQNVEIGLRSMLWSVSYPQHPGCPREFYDPLSQEWWVWWSCCGCGRPVPRELMK